MFLPYANLFCKGLGKAWEDTGWIDTLGMITKVNRVDQRDAAVLFFDGDCGLCQGLVRFALKRTDKAHLRFAPLGGKTAGEILPENGLPADYGEEAVLWLPNQGTLAKGEEAVRALLKFLRWPWPWVGKFLGIFPSGLRRFGYRLVARWRRRLFKPKNSCGLSGPGEQGRFLP